MATNEQASLATEPSVTPVEGASPGNDDTQIVKESEKPSEDELDTADEDTSAFMTMFETPPAPTEVQPAMPSTPNPEGDPSGQVPAVNSDPVVQQPAVVQAPESPQQQVPPVAAQPAQGTQPVQPQAPTEQPQGSVQPQAQPDPTEDAFTQLDQLIEAQRPKIEDAVAKGAYQLTAEQVNGLLEDPGTTVPQLLAKVHVNAVQGVLRHVAQTLPTMLNGMLQVREINRQREDKFWQAWPELARDKHSQQVVQAAQTFRQMNPRASEDEFIRQVGAMVMVMNGLHRAQVPQQPKPQVAQPFVPAGAGRAGAPPSAAAAPQGWEVFTSLMQQED